MSKYLLFFLSLVLFLLSLLNISITQNYRLWQLSVVTKEYGQFFALFTIFILAICLREKKSVLPALAAIFLFLMPTISAIRSEGHWRQELPKTLQKPNSVVGPMLSLPRLFWPSSNPKQAYTRIVIGKAEGQDLHIDFYPAVGREGKVPWIFLIHGGGWESGNSEQLPEFNWHMSRNGYAVAAINYRLLPKYRWPAQKEDALSALQYLKNHADQLNLDLGNYFIMGRSAGAQIGGVVAYRLEDPGLRGLISIYPATDLTFGYEVGDENDILESRPLLRRLFGGDPYQKPELYADASVIEAVKVRPKPTLMLHGLPDRLTWYKHSERLALHLNARNVPFGFVLMPWATHGYDFNLNGPGGQISTKAIEYFLREFTGPPGASAPRQ
jgi:acetyl esterase/lipase